MPKIGSSNEPLLERALFVFDGSLWRPLKSDSSGQIVATLATNQNVQARDHGWYSAAWQKSPLRFGYSSIYNEIISSTNLSAGANTLTGTTVPAGEIWVVTSVAIMYVGTPPVQIVAQIVFTGNTINLYNQLAPVSGTLYSKQGWYVLSPGDKFALVIGGATAGDDAFMYLAGFKTDIDQ